jgi:hypothetical protein
MKKVQCECVKCQHNDYDGKSGCGVCTLDEIQLDKNGVCAVVVGHICGDIILKCRNKAMAEVEE